MRAAVSGYAKIHPCRVVRGGDCKEEQVQGPGPQPAHGSLDLSKAGEAPPEGALCPCCLVILLQLQLAGWSLVLEEK